MMDRFNTDVANHEMIVYKDDGVYRHLRFKRPGRALLQARFQGMKNYLCTACKRRFTTSEGVGDHIRDKHDGKAAALFRPQQPKKKVEREESYADRAIEAQMAIACGERTDDGWLLP